MRLSTLLWLGLAALHQSVNADQVGNPVRPRRDASGWQFKGPYQPAQQLPQLRRPQPYQPIIQQVPIVQPSPSIRQRPMRPVRPLSRQAYVPRMVNDARVMEPYKPVMMDGVVIQPYRPQVTNDMLVQLLPTRGNRFVGLQAGQQAYVKPYEQAYNKISGDSVVPTVNQTQNVKPTSYIAPQAVVQENVIAPSILPSTTEALATHSTTPPPQVAKQTASPSIAVSVPAALSAATPSSETINMYDGFQIVQQPIILDATRLVQPYQPTMEDELAQPDILVQEDVMVHEYLPTLEDAQTDQAFAQSDGGLSQQYRPDFEVEALKLRPYRPNLNHDIPSSYRTVLVRDGSADVSAIRVLSPYRPTLEEPVDVDASAAMVLPPYRPRFEEPVDVDASATMVPPPYRPRFEEVIDVDASATMVPPPYRPTLEKPVDVDASATMVPLSHRPTLQEAVDVDASATMVPPSHRPTLQEAVDVGASAIMVPPPYRPTLVKAVDVDASATMVPLSHRPTLQGPVDVDASATMVPPPYRPTLQEAVDVGASATMVPPPYRRPLEESIRQPYIPSIDESTSDAGIPTTIDFIHKTATSDKSTLSSESSTYSSDASQKDFLLDDSTSLEIQQTTTADSYSKDIESMAVTNDSSNDVNVLESEDFAASTTTQDLVSAVTSEIVATTTTEALVKGFCAGLEVGIHRHPEKCDGIIRCDGVHTILMPSCPSGLLFNNLTKACDYPTSVPECGSSLANDNSAATNCNGHEHGAHVQDPENCGVFWRCVWDELVKMECPKGTFFNEMTSVCDWPQAVPTCEADGARKVAESEKVTTDEE
ncbi:unnamed protein product, partial [Mesorhabditis belari]|uniref:Chitin-binding type-2 domain-containing protein n=1 Tax=Mesorhabditis belari TaxID=2138241 RepID=A0AAF3J6F4_9BILA